MIPYGRHCIDDNDVQAVIDVLRSDFLTQGPTTAAFEGVVSEYCGAKHGVAVNSATSALHLACLALGVGPGDWVWTSPITFVASANCALYCGARIDFVDIGIRTYNFSVECLSDKLSQAEKEGRLPKVVIPVHICGQPCDMEAIYALSQRYGFSIIEDASHAIGAKYQGEPIGNCRYSDITVFSFHPVKIITTGEGGMAITNDPDIATKIALLRSHGITRDPGFMTHESDGPWYYQQIELGYNYRMTDIQAALGISQIKQLDAFVSRRQKLAQSYDELLDEMPVITPYQNPNSASSWHLYIIRLRSGKSSSTHKQVFEYLRDRGIGVNLHYIPVHTQPYYKAMGFKAGQFPIAESYYREAMTLPLFPTMTKDQQHSVVNSLAEILNR